MNTLSQVYPNDGPLTIPYRRLHQEAVVEQRLDNQGAQNATLLKVALQVGANPSQETDRRRLRNDFVTICCECPNISIAGIIDNFGLGGEEEIMEIRNADPVSLFSCVECRDPLPDESSVKLLRSRVSTLAYLSRVEVGEPVELHKLQRFLCDVCDRELRDSLEEERRAQHHQGHRSEDGPDGRRYRKTKKSVWLGREQWIAVPVPDSGIPQETVDTARERVKNNRPAAKTGARFWELSGGIWRCASCGRAMSGTRVGGKNSRRFYYRCPNHATNGREACPNGKHHRAERAEAEVWGGISSLLKKPEQLRTGVARMIENQRRGDPEREVRLWAKRLADVDAKRSRYQEMAAERLIDFDELRSKLDALETDRKTAARELEAVRDKAERSASLKLETEALIEDYSSKARAGLDLYTPQDRFDAYKALGLQVIAHPDGTTELTGGPLRSNLETRR